MIVHCRLDNWWIFFFSGWLDAWWWLVYWRLPTLLIGYICLILLWKKIGWQAKVTEVFQITSDIPAANHRIPVLIFEVDSVNVILTALNYSIMFRNILSCSDHETQQLYKLFATFPHLSSWVLIGSEVLSGSPDAGQWSWLLTSLQSWWRTYKLS